MAQAAQTITEILRNAGYGHRPTSGMLGQVGVHEIFSFNTMEVVAVADAFEALAAVGLEA